ncbi:macro domain-containing protein [Rivularia sp. PCC 7116]|uniref:macro domain-containing protein n=1 Tax=Rivularia sp. PCC 7116 TaxID=373994 RepID=UPI0018DEE563|nr:macro domain-containing protein [Rivularia sp. PCC 7116]
MTSINLPINNKLRNRLSIIKGDLITQSVDAIVNPTNNVLIAAGLCSNIHRAAGENLRRAVSSVKWLDVSKAIITPGFRLLSSHVIHTCAPIWQKERSQESGEELRVCYRNCLEIAAENQIQTLAFPCIGTRLRGFPKDWAARIALKEIISYLAEHPLPMQVKIVCYQSEDYEEYQDQLKHPQITQLMQNSFSATQDKISYLPSNQTVNPKYQKIAQELLTQITDSPKLAVIGSTSFWGDSSKAICKAAGRYLAKIDDLVMLTGGVSGIPEAVSRSFSTNKVFHLQPQGYQPWDYGHNLYGGVDYRERREILARIANVYLLIEGGPGSEHEARRALQMGAVVIPVGRSGGFAEELYTEIDCPDCIPVELWEKLGRREENPEEVGIAIAQIVLKVFEFLDGKQGLAKSAILNRRIPSTVLIVDDSITVRELLSMYFSKAGYYVETARDGKEALDKLQQGIECDVIWCDIEMPRMTGFELRERLKQDSRLKNIPFAIVTSRGVDRKRNEFRKNLDIQGYFTKPYNEEKVLECTEILLNR